MTDEQQRVAPARDSRKLLVGVIAFTLAILVSIFVAVEAARYSGLFARASEWQFNTFGQWLPAFTLVVFVFIPLLIIAFLAWLTRPKSRDKRPKAPDTFESWLVKAQKFHTIAKGVAIATIASAGIALLIGLIIANGGKPIRIADTAAPVASDAKTTMVTGHVEQRLSSTLVFDLLLFHRTARYAPVIEPGKPRAIRYIVELPEDLLDRRTIDERTLTVIEGRVPGPVLTLYRRLGYHIEPDFKLVGGSKTTILWPFLSLAAHLVIAALIAFMIARMQAKRIRRGHELASQTFMSENEALPAT